MTLRVKLGTMVSDWSTNR